MVETKRLYHLEEDDESMDQSISSDEEIGEDIDSDCGEINDSEDIDTESDDEEANQEETSDDEKDWYGK